MENEDGIVSAIGSTGTNKTINFKGGYFSFAFGNEIALVRNESYYILNCDSDLWEEVTKEVKKTKGDTKKIISFWKKQSKKYESSTWSEEFKDLK